MILFTDHDFYTYSEFGEKCLTNELYISSYLLTWKDGSRLPIPPTPPFLLSLQNTKSDISLLSTPLWHCTCHHYLGRNVLHETDNMQTLYVHSCF